MPTSCSSPGPQKPVPGSDGRRFEGIELCSERLECLSGWGGCAPASFPSPRQASSWRWRQLPPRGDAFPPRARRPPCCRDPGSPRPGISLRLPNVEARLRVISVRRKLSADFLPGEGITRRREPDSPAFPWWPSP